MKKLPKLENMTKGEALNIATDIASTIESYIQEIEKSTMGRISKFFQIFKLDFTRQNTISRIETARINNDFGPLLDIMPSILESFEVIQKKLEDIKLANIKTEKTNNTTVIRTATESNLISNEMIQAAQQGVSNFFTENKEIEVKNDEEKDKLEKNYFRKMLEWIGWQKIKDASNKIKSSIEGAKTSMGKDGGVLTKSYDAAKRLVVSMLDSLLDLPQTVSGMLTKGVKKFLGGFLSYMDVGVTMALAAANKLLGPIGIVGAVLMSDTVKEYLKTLIKKLFGEGAVNDVAQKILSSDLLGPALIGAGIGGKVGASIGTLIGGPLGAILGGLLGMATGALVGIMTKWYTDGVLGEKISVITKWIFEKVDEVLSLITNSLGLGSFQDFKGMVSEAITAGIQKLTDGIKSIINVISEFFDWAATALKTKYEEVKKWIYDNTVGWFSGQENEKKVKPNKRLQNFSTDMGIPGIEPPTMFDVVPPTIEPKKEKDLKSQMKSGEPKDAEIRPRIMEKTIEERNRIEKEKEMSVIIQGGSNVRNSTNVQTINKSSISMKLTPVDQTLYGSGIRSW